MNVSEREKRGENYYLIIIIIIISYTQWLKTWVIYLHRCSKPPFFFQPVFLSSARQPELFLTLIPIWSYFRKPADWSLPTFSFPAISTSTICTYTSLCLQSVMYIIQPVFQHAGSSSNHLCSASLKTFNKFNIFTPVTGQLFPMKHYCPVVNTTVHRELPRHTILLACQAGQLHLRSLYQVIGLSNLKSP